MFNLPPRITQAAGLMQRPDETEAEWTARTGGRDMLNALDPFAAFRQEEDDQ